MYAKNWILPRWGNLLLDEVKTVEVERWLRATDVADGTKAKIKCVMSALFSHAVRWEFCGHNPISSGIPVGGGGKRGPSTGVRVSAKRQNAPLVLLAEQVKLGLAQLEFRDQLWCFWIGALGNTSRRTGSATLDGLRLRECSFLRSTFLLLATRRPSEGDKDGGICKTLADASGAEECLGGVESAKPLQYSRRILCFRPIHQKGRSHWI